MIDDIIFSVPRDAFNLPQASWLAGAAAGLQIVGSRTPEWLWRDFVNDIYEMIRMIGEITPAEPGTSPIHGDGLIGSAYDALGGWVSIVGEVCPEGLYFRVPIDRQEEVSRLLKGLTLFRSHGDIVIPPYDIPAFVRLVPLEGPVAEQVELEVTP
ncbi:MAG: hypothetical protein OEV85_10990 [Candidatus Thorarchaeota archaeon]|nr:hypothetical protein [Candidatus Thorarchaeota archaeon]